MKWIKLGQIFDCMKHGLPNNYVGFAQSPQALVLDDRVRVYFSTRERDCSGKYLSHIAFVDFEKNLKNIINASSDTVIELGQLGCFDEHGIFPVNIFKDGDRILAYTTGWNRKISVSADAAIGLAISNDNGLTFQKYGQGPIIASSLHEPFLVGDAFVLKCDNVFHMWYIFGSRWIKDNDADSPDRIYKIAHAISGDGVGWIRDSKYIISDKLNSDECQALPTVFKHKNIYHMYFCYRPVHGFRAKNGNGYRLGYAYSKDLITWVRNDEMAGIEISENGWDSQMQCYPHVFELNKNIYMLYNGNEFGRHGFGLAILDDK